MVLRSIVLVLVLAACGGAARTASTPRAAPARDLAEAKPAAPAPASQRLGGVEAPDPRVIDLDTIRLQVVGKTPGGDTEVVAVATADLFSQASAAWKNGQGDAAIGLFRQLVSEFPDSLYAPLSLFNIAAIYDRRADFSATVAVLKELIAAYPDARKTVEGRLYLAALLAERKAWVDSIDVLDRALAHPMLTYADRIEAAARKGYALLELGKLDESEVALQDAVAQWRRAVRIEDTYFIAMAQYYRGEVARRRFAAVKVELPDDNLGKRLAEKEVLAVQAYDRFKEALGHRHAYWATASGYQMSQIFVELWEAAVRAPYPVAMSRPARPHYVREVHDRVREHLQKALEGHRMNVELAEAYGVSTSWSDASRSRASQISEILSKEASGIFQEPVP